MTYKLYIGSDNGTGKLEIKKAIELIAIYFPGFTYYTATGFWNGERENTLIVEINHNQRQRILECIGVLKSELRQDTIGMVTLPAMRFE